MKILEVSSAEQIGGGERHLIGIVRGLTAKGHSVDLLVRPNSPIKNLFSTYNVLELPLVSAVDFYSALRLSRLLENYDLVHAHYARDYPVVALAMKLARRKRPHLCYVFTRHHYLPVKNNFLYRSLLAEADAAIAVSHYVESRLLERLRWPKAQIGSIDETPCIVHIPNWVDREKICPRLPRDRYLQMLGLPKDRVVITVVNRLDEDKGQHLLLDACACIEANFHVILAGSSASQSYLEKLEAQVRKAGLEKRVTFAGQVEDIASLLAASDICVVPSFDEAFSLSCLEAMSAGRSVIAACAGGLKELIEDGVSGLHFAPGDSNDLAKKLKLLIEDAVLREKLAAVAQKRAEYYSYERALGLTVQLFTELSLRRQQMPLPTFRKF
ncbi:MAG: glycosyltransferase family 4 protein [Acidobacteriota bacterium]|nr:glycosyltransferase family 4 protein [Blastocatellia bacterium]MDW8413490.1 glycosyltransferase family 4 protein [Acidobacteriota bacterium]